MLAFTGAARVDTGPWTQGRLPCWSLSEIAGRVGFMIGRPGRSRRGAREEGQRLPCLLRPATVAARLEPGPNRNPPGGAAVRALWDPIVVDPWYCGLTQAKN